MEQFLDEISKVEQNRIDVAGEVGRVLNELERKSKSDDYFKDRLVKWDEIGDDQEFCWVVEIGILKIVFDIADLTERLKVDNMGESQVIDGQYNVDLVEGAVKEIIKSKARM